MTSMLDKAQILMMRARSIMELMERAERTGADVHEMDNIKHCARGVIDLIECDNGEAINFEQTVSNLERRSVELFKKRFSYMEHGRKREPSDPNNNDPKSRT